MTDFNNESTDETANWISSPLETLGQADLFQRIAEAPRLHTSAASWYQHATAKLEKEAATLRADLTRSGCVSLGELGKVMFAFVEMGSINSTHLFGLDELIIFAFIWRYRDRYERFIDLGANIGLHSVVAARLGFEVTAVEPDEYHLQHLRRHVNLNNVEDRVNIIAAAATPSGKSMSFIRVLGNTTGSHIEGMKRNPYGDLTRTQVPGVDVRGLIAAGDLVKMDIEGSEQVVIPQLLDDGMQGVDIICEVSSEASATAIFHAVQRSGASAFSQKLGWGRVAVESDIPTAYREGSLFISTRGTTPWS